MPIVRAVAVSKGPGPQMPRNRLKRRGCGRGLQLADPITSSRIMYHILVLVCLLLEAVNMSAADMSAADAALQSTAAATTISNEAPIEVPCLPTIAIDPSSTPLAVMSQPTSISPIGHSTSAPDLSSSNNNNNNNDGQQGQSFHSLLPKMPKNFSWVVDGFLAALGFPNEPANMMYLVKHGIKYLISLTAELTPSIRGFEDKLVWSEIKIKDFAPPTLEQVDEFLRVVEKARLENTALAIHCAHGKGRTGTMIACYLIKYHNQTATKALQRIRELRAGSVETYEQEDLVYKFEEKQNQKALGDQTNDSQIEIPITIVQH